MPDEHALAVASLTAAVDALKDTTTSGFDGVNERLDLQNGRLRTVESESVAIRSTMVTTKSCERIRNGLAAIRGATWKSYIIPVAVAVTVLVITKFAG